MAGKFVDVTLRLIDKMTSPLNSAGQALSRQAKQITRAGKQIRKTGYSISEAGSKLTKSVTVPIASIGVVAVKTAADFEAGMSKVASISGDTGNATKSMITLADEMGLSYQKSADGSVKAMDILSAKAHNIKLFYLKRVFKEKLAKPKERDLITKQVRTCLIAVGGI